MLDRLVRSAAAIAATIAATSTIAGAQPARAKLTAIEGAVFVDDRALAALSGPVAIGDGASIRTADGRAVVALKRGGMLTIERQSQVRVHHNGVYNFNRIEVLRGSAAVMSETSAPLVECRSGVRLSSGGVFRFDVQPAAAGTNETCRFRVFDGAAAVPLVSVISALRSGQSMVLDPTCGDKVPQLTFAVEQLDDFDRWSRRVSAAPGK